MTTENRTGEIINEITECAFCKRIDRKKKIIISSPKYDYDGPLVLHSKCNEALLFFGLLLRSSRVEDGHKLSQLANRLAGVQIKRRKD